MPLLMCNGSLWQPNLASRPRPRAAPARQLHLLVLLMLLLCQSAYATAVFRGNFEDEGRTPVRGAVVELRDAAEVVKASTVSDEWSSFRPFAAATMQAGDVIVVYGGNWNDQPFVGEFRLLVDSAASPQNVDPISTVVTAVAGSTLVSGTGAAQRLTNAVTYLTDFGLVDSDWRNGSPLRVNQPLQAAIDGVGGIQNWAAALLADLADADLAPSWMASFPHVHGGVAGLNLGQDLSDWMSGEAGRVPVNLETTLPTPVAGWAYTLLQGPAWVSLSGAGELDFAVPAGTAPGTGSARIRVRNGDSNRYRDLDLPYRVVTGSVLAQATYGALGGTLWTPDNSIGVQIADGTFSASTDLQWVSYQNAEGETMRVLRTQPRDRVFLLSPVLLTPGNQLRTTEGVGACAGNGWEAGWFPKGCTSGNFVSVRRVVGSVVSGVVGLNRLPIGTQWTAPSQLTLQILTPPAQTASTFAALCDQNCANRVPVLFIHGYLGLGGLGGGPGTWGDLPAKLNAEPGANIAAYEFRYRSNARFQDIAADLGAAIESIYTATNNGNKIHIVAHSFGGLVARTYLQGLATNSQPIAAPVAGCVASRHPFVASLLTIGTPHSGLAASAGTLNGTLLPVGRHGALGAGIGQCGQLSCWQAGEPEPFSAIGASAFKTAFGVEAEHGWIPAELSRFAFPSQPPHPLPVPTLVMVGLAETANYGTNYAGGDFLISYQGQRFAPALSCSPGSCSDGTVGNSVLMSIGNQAIGHCVSERVLGNVDPTQAPKPGSNRRPQTIYPQYVHSAKVAPGQEEVEVISAEHLDDGDVEKSKHDTVHRVRDWILRQDPDPGTHRLRLTVSGSGAIVVDNGGTILRCDGLPALPATICNFTVQANIRFRMEPAGAAQFQSYAPTICSGNASNWCDWRVGAYEHISASFQTLNQAALEVRVTGPGQVQVTPGNHLCQSQCRYYYTPGTPVLLSRTALPGGTWTQWSGACTGSGSLCTLALNGTLFPTVVTASFSGTALPPLVGPLNDTGIDWCANATTNTLSCPQSGFPDQDGDYGRDARARAGQLTKIGGGEAGFDYTKISNSGNPLPASATLGTGANDWGCTRDNVTGLIWEVKVNNSASLRHMSHSYNWYDTDSATNGGIPGSAGTPVACSGTLSQCNTSAFVAAVNAQGLCSGNDWRMPSPEELQSIVHYGRAYPPIDSAYFPNTSIIGTERWVWSGRNYAPSASSAWYVTFNVGLVTNGTKSSFKGIRLVRDRP